MNVVYVCVRVGLIVGVGVHVCVCVCVCVCVHVGRYIGVACGL